LGPVLDDRARDLEAILSSIMAFAKADLNGLVIEARLQRSTTGATVIGHVSLSLAFS